MTFGISPFFKPTTAPLFFYETGLVLGIEVPVFEDVNFTEVFELFGFKTWADCLTDFLTWLFYLVFCPLILLSFNKLIECFAVLGRTAAFFIPVYFCARSRFFTTVCFLTPSTLFDCFLTFRLPEPLTFELEDFRIDLIECGEFSLT